MVQCRLNMDKCWIVGKIAGAAGNLRVIKLKFIIILSIFFYPVTLKQGKTTMNSSCENAQKVPSFLCFSDKRRFCTRRKNAVFMGKTNIYYVQKTIGFSCKTTIRFRASIIFSVGYNILTYFDNICLYYFFLFSYILRMSESILSNVDCGHNIL